jgi:hypothetical protein
MLSVLCISCVEALESEDSFAILSVMPKCEGERVNVCCVDIETKHSRNRRRERERERITYYQGQSLQQDEQAFSRISSFLSCSLLVASEQELLDRRCKETLYSRRLLYLGARSAR